MEPGIKVLKLITGETVMADVAYDKLKKHATLKHPLIFNIQYKQSGTVSMVATKWIESKKTSHKIKTYHIIAAVEPTDMMEELYLDSVEEMIEYDSAPRAPSVRREDIDAEEQLLEYLEAFDDTEEETIIVH